MTVTPLGALYAQMCRDRADWKNLPWSEAPPPDRAGLLPPTLTAAAFPRAWARLDRSARERLSQLQLGCETEVFVYLEHALIAAAHGILAALPVDADASPALSKLVEEEYNHVQQFKRYLEVRLPDLYPAGAFAYRFKPAVAVGALVALLGRVGRAAPSVGLLWAEFFELLTIQLHQLLHDLAHEADPLLVALHRMHAREEARHVAIDKIVIARDYDGRRLPGKVARSWGTLGIFALINEIERAGFRALIDRFIQEDPAREAVRGDLAEDVRLTHRTELFTRAAANFAGDYGKLSPLLGQALFDRVILRGPPPSSPR